LVPLHPGRKNRRQILGIFLSIFIELDDITCAFNGLPDIPLSIIWLMLMGE
jgi:hypothetical protein